MKELFYYSIFAIVLYFILTAIFDNFSLEQENFDPSLVPVSSIVTLAKVAQKLVNGNGTLTNPGNLQIGASASAPGNLTVMGGTIINGNGATTALAVTGATTLGGTLGVTGATTVGGTLGVAGATTVGGSLDVSGATTVGGTLGVAGDTTVGDTTVGGTLGVAGATTLSSATVSGALSAGATTLSSANVNGVLSAGATTLSSATVNGVLSAVDTTIRGILNLAVSKWHKSTDGINRIHYGNNDSTFFGTNKDHVWRSKNDTDMMTLDENNKLTVKGDATIMGNLNIAHSKPSHDDNTSRWIKSTDNVDRIEFREKSDTVFNTTSGYQWQVDKFYIPHMKLTKEKELHLRSDIIMGTADFVGGSTAFPTGRRGYYLTFEDPSWDSGIRFKRSSGDNDIYYTIQKRRNDDNGISIYYNNKANASYKEAIKFEFDNTGNGKSIKVGEYELASVKYVKSIIDGLINSNPSLKLKTDQIWWGFSN